MNIDIRACEPDGLDRFAATSEIAFSGWSAEQRLERIRRLLEAERALGAFDEDVHVGTTGAYRFSLSVPGGEVPAAGVTMVGVVPTHRRRGILTAMMRRQLEDIRSWNEPVALLWASEGNLYERFGYGIGSLHGRMAIERDRARFGDRSEGRGRLRLLDVDEASKVVPEVYDAVRRTTPGIFERWAEWWEWRCFSDPEDERHGYGPKFWAVWENEGTAEGYACYRFKHDWSEGIARGTTSVLEAMGTSPTADREIWRFLFGIDLAERVEAWNLPIDHLLVTGMAEIRRLRFQVVDGLWVRLVDLSSALEARTYLVDDELVIDVADEVCPWNAGTWRVRVDGGRAHVERVDVDADLACDVSVLGACYLGGVGVSLLHNAGKVTGLTPGAIARADALFHGDRAPFCPEIF